MTYAISSPLNRYDRGTATIPSLRAAWMVTRTSSEFGPHQTSRSPDRAPAATKPFARRFTIALSSAKVVVDARLPPLLSTITAVLSGCACAYTASTSGVPFIPVSPAFPLSVPSAQCRSGPGSSGAGYRRH
jgi:hypothetical protein